MLKYSLTENLLTDRPDDYSAQAHSVASLDKKAIITRMLNLGTLLTRTDIVAVLNGFEETIAEVILDGHNVKLPLFNTSFSVTGVFETPLDTFDGNRHKVNVIISKGILLREVQKKLKLEKTTSAVPLPQIQEVKDSLSCTVNQALTSNGVVELRGYNLKIGGDHPSCGLWFVAENGAETKADLLIENKPSKIIAMVPTLPAGNYQLKVVTQATSGKVILKTPKMFFYPKTLTVEN